MKSSLSVLTALLVLLAIPFSAIASGPGIDRGNKTEIIRCGYVEYNPALGRDVNTGVLWGIYKDVIEAAATKLDLKVEWTEGVGWGQQVEGINAGRYDMICSPAAVTGLRSRPADYTKPLYYSPVWVRANETCFDNREREALNDPSVRISTTNGEQTDAMADEYFPRTQKISLPQTSDRFQLTDADYMISASYLSAASSEHLFEEPLDCIGTEPFWSMKVADSIRFEIMGQDPHLLAGRPAQRSANHTNVWFLSGEKVRGQHSLSAFIRKSGRCSDGMSDRTYEYDVFIKTEDNAYSGCCNAMK